MVTKSFHFDLGCLSVTGERDAIVKNHVNHCLDCQSRNCCRRQGEIKTSDCLEVDYRNEIKLPIPETEIISQANTAIQKALEKRMKGDFTLNWLKTFLKEFFGAHITVGIACCIGSIETARTVIEAIESEGMTTALVTCKLGGLTVQCINREGEAVAHPSCNPVAQARILNSLGVPVVVLVGLCIGHDMIFIKNCQSYVIPFITKMPMRFGGM